MSPVQREFSFEYERAHQVSPLIRRVVARNPGRFTGPGSGTLIVGRDEVAVIDPGPDMDEHFAALNDAVVGQSVSHVLVTHQHIDHSALARRFADYHGALLCGRRERVADDEGGAVREEACDDKSLTPDIELHEGWRTHGAGWTLRALHMPGHTSQHHCFVLEEENTLLCGDNIMAWSTSIVSPPDGDMGAYLASLARANIDALKRLGCTDVVAVSAVGALREELPPGSFAAARQYIDRTRQRPSSFFGGGVIGHVSMADPVCPRLTQHILAAGRDAGVELKDGAVYVAIEGPQFSTRAESQLYRQWGGDLIGMTSMPEARLAREAELPYANLCMVTDYDCWRSEEAANVPEILRVMRANVSRAKDLIARLAQSLPAERTASPIDTCLDTAIISAPDKWSEAAAGKLDAVLARFLRAR